VVLVLRKVFQAAHLKTKPKIKNMSNAKFFKKGEKKSMIDAFPKMDDKQMSKVAGGAAVTTTTTTTSSAIYQAMIDKDKG
jgi:hypothetical protein